MIDDDFCGSSDEGRRFDRDMANVVKGWTPGSQHCQNYLRDQLRLDVAASHVVDEPRAFPRGRAGPVKTAACIVASLGAAETAAARVVAYVGSDVEMLVSGVPSFT